MFVEVNELRSLVVHPPAGGLAHPDPWAALADRLRCAFLVGGQERAAWERWARGRRCEVLAWSPDYLIPGQGNIRAALEALDAQPCESVYVCFDGGELREAIPTRVGTLLVGEEPGESLPDDVAPDVADAISVLAAVAGGALHGYAAEVFGSVGQGFGRRSGFFLAEAAGIVPPEMAGRMAAVVTGRYFASGDARHNKHQPTHRLLRLKERAHYGLPFVLPLASVLGLNLPRAKACETEVLPCAAAACRSGVSGAVGRSRNRRRESGKAVTLVAIAPPVVMDAPELDVAALQALRDAARLRGPRSKVTLRRSHRRRSRHRSSSWRYGSAGAARAARPGTAAAQCRAAAGGS